MMWWRAFKPVALAVFAFAALGSHFAPLEAQSFRVANVSKSVVFIAACKDPPECKTASRGSGFVVAPGVVVTNFHVVQDSKNFIVLRDSQPVNEAVAAEVILLSQTHDIAILRAPGLSAPAVRIAVGEPTQGVNVWAMGFPGAAEGFDINERRETFSSSITTGIVSRVFVGKTITGKGSASRLVQHTALIAPGSSGGPLFDQCQRVVGINAQSTTQDGVTYVFAVAGSLLPDLLRQAGVSASLSTGPCGDSPGAAGGRDSEDAMEEAEPHETGADEVAAPPSSAEQNVERKREIRRADDQAASARARAAQARKAQEAARASGNTEEADRQARIASQADKAAKELENYANAVRAQIEEGPDPSEQFGPGILALLALLGLGLTSLLGRHFYQRHKLARDAAEKQWLAAQAEVQNARGVDVSLRGPLGTLVLPGEILVKGLVVGRSSDRADVVLTGDHISRVHARFFLRGDKLYVIDESKEGTTLNGTALTKGVETQVRANDRLDFADKTGFIVTPG